MNFETWLRSDLTKPLKVETLPGVFFTADNAANIIGVEVYDGGAAAILSGSCMGYAIRADGDTVIVTGTISGNRASITLPASAYVMEGPIDIVIKVVNGSVKTTVGACHGYVVRSTTDAIIDPGHIIPSIEELLAQIEACEQATEAANAAAANADRKAAGADTAAAGANAAAANADTAKDRANTAASALENMDATASGLASGAAPTAMVSTINDHYRIAFGIPKGDKGDTGDTGAAATITSTATAYQNSTSGTTIPTGAWLDTQPDTPQGQFLWIRTILTWNNGQTTTMYSVSRMGIDGRGSVSSVNGISPDANGNVTLPIDTTPTQDSQNPVTSGGAYAALADKQGTLTFDSAPTSGSTNPVTSGGVYASIIQKINPGNTANVYTGDVDNLKETGNWLVTSGTHRPPGTGWCTISIDRSYSDANGSIVVQKAVNLVNADLWVRQLNSNVWSNWAKVTYETELKTVAILGNYDNTAPQAITSGQYVIWNGALYAATTNIPSGGTLSTSNLQAVTGGGLNALAPKKTIYQAEYVFPTGNSEVSGSNNEYVVPYDGVAFIKYVFSDMQYSQFSLVINGYNAINPITSGKNNLNGVTGSVAIPVTKGDVVKVSFYSTFTMRDITLRLFSNRV